MRKVNGVYIPTPPRGASHFLLEVDSDCCSNLKRKAIVPIADVDVLMGTQGNLKFVKARKGKVLKEFDHPTYTWNGKYIDELEEEIKVKENES